MHEMWKQPGEDSPLGEHRGYFLLVSPEDRPPDTLGLRQVINLLWGSRVLIIFAALAGSVLALAFAFLRTPVYRAETVLAVRSEDLQGSIGGMRGQLGGLASLAGITLGGGENKRNEYMAFLKSRALARQFIVEQDLMPILYRANWDASSRTYRPGFTGHVPTVGDAIDQLDDIKSIRDDTRTGLVTVAFESEDPETVATWANAYVAMANELLRREAADDARDAIKFLNDALSKSGVEPIRQNLFRLLEGRLNQAMLATVEPEYAFKVVDRAEVPEVHKFVRPKRVAEVLIGTFFGAFAGCVFALFRRARAGPT